MNAPHDGHDPDVAAWHTDTAAAAAAAAGAGADAHELAALLDDEAVAAAVRRRRAAREGRERAREAATWVGTLRDLVERGAWITVRTITGVRVSGVLVGVADDHLVLRLGGGGDGGITVVARDATTAIQERPRPGAPNTAVPAAGDRAAPIDRTLLEVLDRWREDGATVQLIVGDGDSERGRFATVGDDVVSLVTTAGTVHVPVGAIVAVTVR